MTPGTLARLTEARATKRPVALLTKLDDGTQYLWPDDPTPLDDAARDAVAADQAVSVDGWFIQPHNPPLRLLIVGAVHVSQHLAPMALPLGYAVTVIDPRRAFATEERFAGITINGDWPDDAMAALAPDSRTAIVTLTHDPKLDDPALDAALRSQAFYIGALGSRRTHAKRVERLRELGHDDAAIGRIRAPVGLPIKAVTAPEIALSVLGEIVAARRGALSP